MENQYGSQAMDIGLLCLPIDEMDAFDERTL